MPCILFVGNAQAQRQIKKVLVYCILPYNIAYNDSFASIQKNKEIVMLYKSMSDNMLGFDSVASQWSNPTSYNARLQSTLSEIIFDVVIMEAFPAYNNRFNKINAWQEYYEWCNCSLGVEKPIKAFFYNTFLYDNTTQNLSCVIEFTKKIEKFTLK